MHSTLRITTASHRSSFISSLGFAVTVLCVGFLYLLQLLLDIKVLLHIS